MFDLGDKYHESVYGSIMRLRFAFSLAVRNWDDVYCIVQSVLLPSCML